MTIGRPQVYAHAITKDRENVLGPPDVVNDISDVADVKLAAVRAHRSQSEAMLSWLGSTKAGPQQQAQMRRLYSAESFWIYRFAE